MTQVCGPSCERQVTVPVADRSRSERGVASVQMAFIFPLLLGVLWAAMSAALYVYGRAAALNAAATGAAAAAARNGSVGECEAAAHRLLSTVGDALTQVSVTCTRTATTATATVRGISLSLVPGWSPTATQSASAPVERVT